MDTSICERKISDLLGMYIPSTVWWAIAGVSIVGAIFFGILVMIFVFHAQRPHNRRMDALVEDLWRFGSFPLLLLGIAFMYSVYRTVIYFGMELHYLMLYHNHMCLYPTADAVVTHIGTAL